MTVDAFQTVLGSQRGPDSRDHLLSDTPGDAGRRELAEVLAAVAGGQVAETLALLRAHPDRPPLLAELAQTAPAAYGRFLADRWQGVLRDRFDLFGVRPWMARTLVASWQTVHVKLPSEDAGAVVLRGSAACGAGPGRDGWRPVVRGGWLEPEGSVSRCPNCQQFAGVFSECAEARQYEPLPQPWNAVAAAEAEGALAEFMGYMAAEDARSPEDYERALTQAWRDGWLRVAGQYASSTPDSWAWMFGRATGGLTEELGPLHRLFDGGDFAALVSRVAWPAKPDLLSAARREEVAELSKSALRQMKRFRDEHEYASHASDAFRDWVMSL